MFRVVKSLYDKFKLHYIFGSDYFSKKLNYFQQFNTISKSRAILVVINKLFKYKNIFMLMMFLRRKQYIII